MSVCSTVYYKLTGGIGLRYIAISIGSYNRHSVAVLDPKGVGDCPNV